MDERHLDRDALLGQQTRDTRTQAWWRKQVDDAVVSERGRSRLDSALEPGGFAQLVARGRKYDQLGVLAGSGLRTSRPQDFGTAAPDHGCTTRHAVRMQKLER
jgi:hypothetical protein